ncbi:MAG TPA: SCO family protein [Ramlibacter sp.]|uniref:SCO family protein n=1 Tax=Ramlibacter sp. TaxID=1917967 RepID=UPI002D806AC3|nr:SCO family protein [Ramlibacter sp.]HET8748700.1 SCO family protein [Ramlibacter sp.]
MSTIRSHASVLAAALAAAAFAALAPLAWAGGEHAHHHHQHVEVPSGYARQVALYQIPSTALLRADGARAQFPQAIDDGKPVVLDFIYTSCTAICPILSHSFAEFQRRLGAESEQVHLVSISIDPEEDTPARLSEYARRFDAGRQWAFFTGSTAASVSLQKAFQAYYGGKMHHRPATFLRAAPGEPWVRLDGFTSPDELMAEYRRLVHRH